MTDGRAIRAELARRELARRHFRDYLRYVHGTAWIETAMSRYLADRAQAFLERCLERRPNDPAVLNNLAQCRLRRGDPAGALPYAERALAALPDAPEVKRTLERVRAALEKRKSAERPQ